MLSSSLKIAEISQSSTLIDFIDKMGNLHKEPKLKDAAVPQHPFPSLNFIHRRHFGNSTKLCLQTKLHTLKGVLHH